MSDAIRSCINPLGGLDVNVQDQMTNAIILPMAQLLGSTSLSIAAVVDESEITLDSVVGVSAGNHVRIIDTDNDWFYFGTILSLTGSVAALDTPLDHNYSEGSEVTYSNTNMAVDGSTTPVSFLLRTGSPSISTEIDITRIVIICQCESAVSLNTFGDISGGLTKGLVFRESNGVKNNILNIKTNADLVGVAYDFTVFEATNPAQGIDGFSFRLTFAGQEKMGVVIRVTATGQLEMIVQDDLSSLVSLYCTLEGHEVD
jgi:hypothetical protein